MSKFYTRIMPDITAFNKNKIYTGLIRLEYNVAELNDFLFEEEYEKANEKKSEIEKLSNELSVLYDNDKDVSEFIFYVYRILRVNRKTANALMGLSEAREKTKVFRARNNVNGPSDNTNSCQIL